jgi:hypothetical protein
MIFLSLLVNHFFLLPLHSYFIIDADMAKLVDALDLGSSGRPWGFESLYPHSKQTLSAPC